MRDYTIYTDSTCDLTDEMYRAAGLEIFRMSFFIGNDEYIDDGKTLAGHDFYQKMREGAMPTTVQYSMESFTNAFESVLKSGRDVIYLCFASACSGQFQTVQVIARELSEKYPDGKVYVVDSQSQCGGEGRLALAMAEKKAAGMDIDTLYAWTLENRQFFIHYFTVDDLGHLYRGGRLSKASAIAGTMLGIKPVMYTATDGKLTVGSKVRGRKASLKMLCDRMFENAVEPEKQDMIINHADCPEDAEWMRSYIEAHVHPKSITILPLGPIIGSHVGPGCIALFFTGKTRLWHA